MLVLRECRGRSWRRAGIAFLQVHAVDEAVRNGVNVPYLAIRKNFAIEVLHELMNLDISLASLILDYFNGFHVRIKFVPLTSPVGTNAFFSNHTTAFRGLRP